MNSQLNSAHVRYEEHRVSHRHDLCVSLLGPLAFRHWHFSSPRLGEVAMGHSARRLRAAGTGCRDLAIRGEDGVIWFTIC